MISEEERKRVKTTITRLLKLIPRKGMDGLLEFLEDSNFFTSPASTMFHGNFPGGLASHSLEVYREFNKRIESYGLKVPAESRVIGALCHDFCKIDNYVENKLKSGNVSEAKPYKVEDSFPVGHGEKSAMIVQRYILLTNQEAMLIRWHMGHDDPAWEDYKDRVEKEFPEVVLLYHADKEVSLLKGI